MTEIDFPTDTIIDTDPDFEGMGEEYANDCRIVMKSIYLAHPAADELRQQGLSNTDIVNSFETLRRKKLIRVVWDDKSDKIWVELT